MTAPDHGSEGTLPPKSLSVGYGAAPAEEASALVVLWSRDEPARAGEALIVPAGASAAPWIFGRGEASPFERRVFPAQQRPGGSGPASAVECPRISRAQLRLTAGAGGELLVENAGRCPLVFQGREVEHALLRPGDVVELRHEILFLCVARPPALAELPEDYPTPLQPFGEADAFGLVGESPVLWELRRRIAAVARGAAHVLVQGPSGSGKELVAQAIHALSARGQRPLVSRNAATIPESLVDAELFGNLKNYPNPGTPERPGLIGQADGSSLFLDEIAELPASIQAHLLRVLDQGEHQRLGEATARHSDFRLIAATNRPEGALKHDVFARFQAHLALPALDARPEDIPLLVTHLLRRQAAADPSIARRFFPGADPRAHPRVAPALVRALVQHRYTTHVRELGALLGRATLSSASKYVELTEEVSRALSGEPRPLPVASGGRAPSSPPVEGLTKEEAARLAIHRKHRFRASDCGRDPAYPGNRQTADLHLRQLVCRALAIAAWDVAGAASLLAGEGDADLRERAEGRIETFIANLERRLGGGETGGGGDDEALRRSLSDEWRGGTEGVLRVLEAIQRGWIRGRKGA
jgi:two-component system nitrogen regulation response regulator GlnG/two-component system response regulator HydG